MSGLRRKRSRRINEVVVAAVDFDAVVECTTSTTLCSVPGLGEHLRCRAESIRTKPAERIRTTRQQQKTLSQQDACRDILLYPGSIHERGPELVDLVCVHRMHEHDLASDRGSK